MSFSGDLKGIQLADVFQNILANRLTGTIRVSSRQGERHIYFHEGLVAGFSFGLNKGLPIGQHLVARGYVEPLALANAMKRKTKTRRPLRLVLAEQGLLEEPAFLHALRELLEDSVFEVLALREATYEFNEGEPGPRLFDSEQKSARLAIDPNGILMESARRQDEWERIRRVVLSDRDLFVTAEGFDAIDESEVRPIVADVTAALDGHTEIGSIIERLPYSRFDVLKVVSDLVMSGAARPLTATEVEQMAGAALQSGDDERAITLLSRALMLERNNRDLRLQLANVYERQGRAAEAAGELALLAYQSAEEGDAERALAHYSRAAELNPNDLMLHERRLELLRSGGDPAQFVIATLHLVDLSLQLGLAERARTALQAALEEPWCRRNTDLLLRLAEIEARSGHGEEAARIFLDLASHSRVEAEQVRYLQAALQHRPHDDALRHRLQDLMSGRARQRRRRRRRLLVSTTGLCVVLALGTAGVVELRASFELTRVVEDHLASMTAARPSAALPEIETIARDYSWTLTGRRAGRLVPRIVEFEIRHLEQLMAAGGHRQAMAGLTELGGRVQRRDIRQRIEALTQRAQLESVAASLFARVNNEPRPDARSLRQLEELTDPRHLDFLLARLGDPATMPHTRLCLLGALKVIDSPRAMPIVARLYLHSTDPNVNERCRAIFGSAERHQKLGHESSWSAVYGELEAARSDPALRRRAEEVLLALRGR